MRLGVVLDILWPVQQIECLARAAAESGFDQVWVSDHPLGHDPFVVLAHLARELPNIKLGLGTINPSARHPAVIAASAGTLSHLSGGRFTLGIGSSVNALLHPIGLDVKGQVQRCRESIRIIRSLLEHGRSSMAGELFETADAKSLFDGAAALPVLIGCSGGPAMLKMSGEEANGVIIPAGNRGFYEYAIERFSSVNTDSAGAQIVVNGNIAVDQDEHRAIASIRPLVADAIAHRARNEHSLRYMGITLEQARGWQQAPETVPLEVVRACAVAGTPAQCLDGLRYFESLGVTELAIRFPEESTIRAVGEHLVPHLPVRRDP